MKSLGHGFTLLELTIALAIAGIALAMAVPGLGRWVNEQQVDDRADALLHGLDRARGEAIRRGGRVDVCPGSGNCAAGALPWENGWSIVADTAHRHLPAVEPSASLVARMRRFLRLR